MSSDESNTVDERFTDLLAACDDALAAGASPPSPPDVAGEQRERLDNEVAWCGFVRAALGGEATLAGLASTAGASHLHGRFVVGHELGRGSFGIVYLALDPLLGRKVALKVPRPEVLVSPELRARFRHEAQAAARLDHPNLVRVYEAGEEGAVCYIASAYCPGPTLAAWLRAQTSPVPIHARRGGLLVVPGRGRGTRPQPGISAPRPEASQRPP